MAGKASIKKKKPFSDNNECNNPAYESIELQMASLQLELKEIILNKNIILAAEDRQTRIKKLIKGMRKFLLLVLDQPSNVYRLYKKKII